MAPSRKSPLSPMAAMFSQVYPSPATWVKFELGCDGRMQIDKIGQFLTGFAPDGSWHEEFRTKFRTTYVHPYYGQLAWAYTPSNLGLVPCYTFPRYDWEGEPLAAPTNDELKEKFSLYAPHEKPLRDTRDPYVFWSPTFIVKLQHAHKVLGCTAEEFEQVHLQDFYERLVREGEDLIWYEEEEERQRDNELSRLIHY